MTAMAQRVDVRVPDEAFERWSEAAELEGVKMPEFVRRVVENHVDGRLTQDEKLEARLDAKVEEIRVQVSKTLSEVDGVGARLEGLLGKHLCQIDSSLHSSGRTVPGRDQHHTTVVPTAAPLVTPSLPGEVPLDVISKPWGLMREARPYGVQCDNTGTEAHGQGKLCSSCAGNGLQRDETYTP